MNEAESKAVIAAIERSGWSYAASIQEKANERAVQVARVDADNLRKSLARAEDRYLAAEARSERYEREVVRLENELIELREENERLILKLNSKEADEDPLADARPQYRSIEALAKACGEEG